MKRSVEIHSGWPHEKEKLHKHCSVETKHAASEGWTIFGLEDGKRVHGMLTRDWKSVMDYAMRWMMGESAEAIEEVKE